MAVPEKVKLRLTIQPSNSSPDKCTEGWKARTQTDIGTPMSIAAYPTDDGQMSVINPHQGMSLHCKKKGSSDACCVSELDVACAQWNKPVTDGQMPYGST